MVGHLGSNPQVEGEAAGASEPISRTPAHKGERRGAGGDSGGQRGFVRRGVQQPLELGRVAGDDLEQPTAATKTVIFHNHTCLPPLTRRHLIVTDDLKFAMVRTHQFLLVKSNYRARTFLFRLLSVPNGVALRANSLVILRS